MRRSRINSTTFGLIALAIACIVLAFVGGVVPVGGGLTKQRTRLTFWNGFTGPDGRVMLEMIRQFNVENPDIEVVMQRIPWALYYNKIMVSGLDGRGPEVFVVHSSALTRMKRANILAPVTNLFDATMPESDFDPYVIEQTKFGEEFYSVPLDIHPQGMFVNAKMMIEVGMTNPDGTARAPKNREEFIRVAKALLKAPSGKDGQQQYGFALTAWQNNFTTLLPQFDGRYLDEDGNADLDCEGNIKALEFMASLRGEKPLIPPPDNQLGWTGYRQQKVGMVWDGIYMLGDLLRLDGMKYLGAPIPVIGNHAGTLADSHTLCVKPGLDKKQTQAAKTFISFLSANSIEWAKAGQVPARRSVRDTSSFKNLQVQSAFAEQIPNMKYPPRISVLFELGLEIQLAVEKVIRGRTTAKEALKIADQNAQKAIDRDRASARGNVQ